MKTTAVLFQLEVGQNREESGLMVELIRMFLIQPFLQKLRLISTKATMRIFYNSHTRDKIDIIHDILQVVYPSSNLLIRYINIVAVD